MMGDTLDDVFEEGGEEEETEELVNKVRALGRAGQAGRAGRAGGRGVGVPPAACWAGRGRGQQ